MTPQYNVEQNLQYPTQMDSSYQTPQYTNDSLNYNTTSQQMNYATDSIQNIQPQNTIQPINGINSNEPSVNQIQQPVPQTQLTQPEIKPIEIKSKNSNIDLLLGIDFSSTDTNNQISVIPLQPNPINTNDTNSEILVPSKAPSILDSKPEIQSKTTPTTPIDTINRVQEFITSATTLNDRKSSIDNLSIASDLSSIDQNFDWDSASTKNDDTIKLNRGDDDNLNVILMKFKNPFDDSKVLKNFHKEIERLEKLMETLNVKNLNGTTQLDSKWKDLQDLLVWFF